MILLCWALLNCSQCHNHFISELLTGVLQIFKVFFVHLSFALALAGHDDHGEDFAERRSRSRWSLRSQACNTSLPLPRQHCHHSVSTLSTLNTLSILDTLNTSNTLIILKSTGFTERALGRVQARATEHGKTGKTGKGKPELSSQEENGGDEKGEHKDKKLQRHKDKKTTETQRQKYTHRKRQKYRDTKQKKVTNKIYRTALFARCRSSWRLFVEKFLQQTANALFH